MDMIRIPDGYDPYAMDMISSRILHFFLVAERREADWWGSVAASLSVLTQILTTYIRINAST